MRRMKTTTMMMMMMMRCVTDISYDYSVSNCNATLVDMINCVFILSQTFMPTLCLKLFFAFHSVFLLFSSLLCTEK